MKIYNDQYLEDTGNLITNIHGFEVFLKDDEFTKNPSFNLKYEEQTPLPGSFEGEKNFHSDLVHDDNFTQLFDGRSISKIAMGTFGTSFGLTD